MKIVIHRYTRTPLVALVVTALLATACGGTRSGSPTQTVTVPAEASSRLVQAAGQPAATKTPRPSVTLASGKGTPGPARSARAAPARAPSATRPASSPSPATQAGPAATPEEFREEAGPGIFGVQIAVGRAPVVAEKARAAGVSWVRLNGIRWSDVEPAPGSRNWDALAAVEAGLQALAAQDLTPIVVVSGTPSWAQKVAGSSCGPIRDDALDDFARFSQELVLRYGGPPYHVKYWEFWNEPDVDPALVAADSVFGCWGDQSDPYYGGGYYAEMLKQVYPAIKEIDPAAQVILGGLLLDCDPRTPPPGKACEPARFLEGVLRNGGAPALDIIAYHGYAQWNPNVQDWDLNFPSWQHNGGVLLGKLEFIRSVLRQYGVEKPIMLGEGGLNCHPNQPGCPNEELRAAQANYVIRLYTRAWAHGLHGAIWYTLNGPGWRHGGLLDRGQRPLPAYQALAFLASLLHNARYAGELSEGALEGYRFRDGGVEYEVMWSVQGSEVPYSLPAGSWNVYGPLGQKINVEGPALTVGFEPVIVERAADGQ